MFSSSSTLVIVDRFSFVRRTRNARNPFSSTLEQTHRIARVYYVYYFIFYEILNVHSFNKTELHRPVCPSRKQGDARVTHGRGGGLINIPRSL